MASSSGRLHHPSLPAKPVADLGGRDAWRGRELFASGDDINSKPLQSTPSATADMNDGQTRRSLASRLSGDKDVMDDRRRESTRSSAGTEWSRDLPPHHHLPPRPRDRYESPPPRSDARRAQSPPRRGDGRDTYRPHDTYRPSASGAGNEDDNRRGGFDRDRDVDRNRDFGRDHPRDDQRGHRDNTSTGMRFRDEHYGREPDPSRGNVNYRADQPMPPPPHSMPPFRPTMPGGGTGGGGGGNTAPPPSGPANLEQRRQLRESTQVNIWPESPKRSYGELIGEDEKAKTSRRSGKKSKSSRRRRRYTSDSESDSDSEYERERRRRKRRQRDKERSEDEGRDRRRRRTVDSEDERDRKRDRGERSRRHTPDSDRDARRHRERDSRSPSKPAEPEARDDGPEVGPLPPGTHDIKLDREAFRDLLPGEGAAMQAFLEKGQRIPRRGEIGMDQGKIAQLEGSGYVMSGSRHARMTAVRLRKEGQVINAEEKRAMLLQERERWIEKEGAIISQFKEMMDERLKIEEKKERERDDGEGKGKGKRRE